MTTIVTPAIVYTTALCSDAHVVMLSQNDEDDAAAEVSKTIGLGGGIGIGGADIARNGKSG